MMPDWSSHGDHPLSDQEITDLVAWVASHRASTTTPAPEPAIKPASLKTSKEPVPTKQEPQR